jgi:hypothetical protein
MMKRKGTIEFICEGGYGGEAEISVELRTEFPGIGGTIITQEGIAAAYRENYNPMPKQGHRMFVRHTIIKKLEDYFYRLGQYSYAHITRPLGSISITGPNPHEAYIYEWAFGTDRFSWEYIEPESGRSIPVELRDWDQFNNAFLNVGIDLQRDCTDAEDGRISQNVVHQFPDCVNNNVLSCLWKRIDFGESSIHINYDKLHSFLRDKEDSIRETLSSERYEMLILAYEYLINRPKMNEISIGRLDALLGDYRFSTLRHLISRGTGINERKILEFRTRTESL